MAPRRQAAPGRPHRRPPSASSPSSGATSSPLHTFPLDRPAPRFVGRNAAPLLFGHLQALEAGGDTRFAAAAADLLARPGPPGLTVVLSDLLTPEWETGLTRLPARGGDVTVVHVLDPESSAPTSSATSTSSTPRPARSVAVSCSPEHRRRLRAQAAEPGPTTSPPGPAPPAPPTSASSPTTTSSPSCSAPGAKPASSVTRRRAFLRGEQWRRAYRRTLAAVHGSRTVGRRDVTFANPAGLGLLALAIPVLLLHILRPRRRRWTVSSTFLWRAVGPAGVGGLAVAAAAAVRAAVPPAARRRPARRWRSPARAAHRRAAGRSTPCSSSTLGVDGGPDGEPDRLDAAKDRARELRDAAARGRAGQRRRRLTPAPGGPHRQPRPRRVRRRPRPPSARTAGTADFAGAFILAESLETPGAPIGFELLSDGGLTDAEQRCSRPGTGYEQRRRPGHQPGHHPPHRRAPGQRPPRPRHARNTGGAGADADAALDVDGRTAAHRVEVAPAARRDPSTGRSTSPPATGSRRSSRARTSSTPTTTPTPPPRRRPRACRVLLAGPENPFLERLLAAIRRRHRRAQRRRRGRRRASTSPSTTGWPCPPTPARRSSPSPRPAAPPASPSPARSSARPSRSSTPTTRCWPGSTCPRSAIATAQRLDPGAGDQSSSAPRTRRCCCGAAATGGRSPTSASPWPTNLPLQVAFPSSSTACSPTWPAPPCRPATSWSASRCRSTRRAAAPWLRPGGATARSSPGGAAPVADRPGFWTDPGGRPSAERVVAVNADAGESDARPGRRACPPAPAGGARRAPRHAGERRAAALGGPRRCSPSSSPPSGSSAAAGGASAGASGGPPSPLRVAIAAPRSSPPLGRRPRRRGRRDRVATVFLLDGSDSLGAAGRAEAVDWVRDALGDQPDGAVAGVACFGGDARLELTVQPRRRALDAAVARSTPPAPTWPAPCAWPAPCSRPTPAAGSWWSPTGGPPTATPPPRPRRLAEAGIAGRRPRRRPAPAGPTLAVAASTPRPGSARARRSTVAVTIDRRHRPGRCSSPCCATARSSTSGWSTSPAGRHRGRRFPQVAGDRGLGRYQARVSRPRATPSPRTTSASPPSRSRGRPRVLLAEGTAGRGRRRSPPPCGPAASPSTSSTPAPCRRSTGWPPTRPSSSSTSTPARSPPSRSPPWRAATRDLGHGPGHHRRRPVLRPRRLPRTASSRSCCR